MSFSKDYFDIIKIKKDGNCLFRSIAVFLDKSLIKSRRQDSGIMVNTIKRQYEDNSTLFLRRIVVRNIESKKSRYSHHIYYDNDLYDSIDNRIEKMYQNGEFGGKLEIDTLARMNKIVICVFIYFDEGLSCVYRTDNETDIELDLNDMVDEHEADYTKSRFCFLLLDENHYSLMSPNYEKFKLLNTKLKQKETRRSIQIIEHDRFSSKLSTLSSESSGQDKSVYNTNYLHPPDSLDSSYSSISMNELKTDNQIFYSNSSCQTEHHSENHNDNSKNISDEFTTLINSGKNGIIINNYGIEEKPKIIELKDCLKKLTYGELLEIIDLIK